jgi:hypothetical protein
VDANQNVGHIERIISAVAAVQVSIYVVKRKDTFVGKVLGSMRGFLLTRAATGYCPLKKVIDRNSL